jgi:hypothetical protein
MPAPGSVELNKEERVILDGLMKGLTSQLQNTGFFLRGRGEDKKSHNQNSFDHLKNQNIKIFLNLIS